MIASLGWAITILNYFFFVSHQFLVLSTVVETLVLFSLQRALQAHPLHCFLHKTMSLVYITESFSKILPISILYLASPTFICISFYLY
jgi:hypothetical protein